MNASLKNIADASRDSEIPTQNAARNQAASSVEIASRDDFDRDVWSILGMPIDIANVNDALSAIDNAKRDAVQLSVVTPNINWFVRAMADKSARNEVTNANLSLVDGAPLVKIAKWLGAPISSRVAGSDLFEALRRRPGFPGSTMSVFFFGGRDGAAEAAVEALNREGGGIKAVGSLNPGFGSVETMSSDAIIDQINAADPDFVVVALGAAKGQAWIERNLDRLNARIISHLGAVVDFTAGTIARAPVFWQRAGLEWLWRIRQEPALWSRYAKDAFSLARVMMTQLAPALWARFRAKPAGSPAHAALTSAPLHARIDLSGDASHKDLDTIRKAFRAAAKGGRDVVLGFSDDFTGDAAFFGQILMLQKHLQRSGARIFVTGESRAMKTQLTVNKINVLEWREGEQDAAPARDQAMAS